MKQQQFLAQMQHMDATALVHPILITLSQQHDDVEAAVCKLALAELVKEGYPEEDLSMISCTAFENIMTVTEPVNPALSESIADRIISMYPTANLAEGWIIKSSDCIDMAFSIEDKDAEGNEYHCYLTYTLETNRFSGAFGYWTINQGMPTDKQFNEFQSLHDLSVAERLVKTAFLESQYITTAIPALADAVRDFITKVTK